MFDYIRNAVKRYNRIVYIRFKRGEVVIYHYPLGLRYRDEPMLAVKKKGDATIVTAIGKEVYDLKAEDTSIVVTPFDSFEREPENFDLSQKAVRHFMQKNVPFMQTLFAPRVIIHPDKSYLSEMEEHTYKELALSAGARKAVVYVGDELSAEALEGIMQNRKA